MVVARVQIESVDGYALEQLKVYYAEGPPRFKGAGLFVLMRFEK
jgi:hypothetical protein